MTTDESDPGSRNGSACVEDGADPGSFAPFRRACDRSQSIAKRHLEVEISGAPSRPRRDERLFAGRVLATATRFPITTEYGRMVISSTVSPGRPEWPLRHDRNRSCRKTAHKDTVAPKWTDTTVTHVRPEKRGDFLRIAELSRRSGIALPTIKYYLRGGLLPLGERTGRNQARYGDLHIGRLRLIRALVDIGRMSLAQVREILSALQTPERTANDVLALVQRRLSPPTSHGDDTSWHRAMAEVTELIERHEWSAKGDSPAAHRLADVIARMWRLGYTDFTTTLDRYAHGCEIIAEQDLEFVASSSETEHLVEKVVVGTVLGDSAISAIRQLAQQDASARRFESGTRPDSLSTGERAG